MEPCGQQAGLCVHDIGYVAQLPVVVVVEVEQQLLVGRQPADGGIQLLYALLAVGAEVVVGGIGQGQVVDAQPLQPLPPLLYYYFI